MTEPGWLYTYDKTITDRRSFIVDLKIYDKTTTIRSSFIVDFKIYYKITIQLLRIIVVLS